MSPRAEDRLTERVILGRSGFEITRIGLGAWAIGGSNQLHSWSLQSDSDSVEAIERALELGINWIDTAAVYGLGHSEEVIGRTLEGVSARPLVFTKCAALEAPFGRIQFSLKRDSILSEVEESMRRLRVDRLDLYQIHRPLPPDEIEEGWRTLVELKEQGVVSHIGVSNFSADQLRQLEEIAPVETVQPPYSLLRREAADDLFPYTQRLGIGVIAYSPMASGLLSGMMTRERLQALPEQDWRRHDARFSEPVLSRGLELVERLRVIGARHDATPGEVAIAWTLLHPAIHGVIVGFRTAAQVDGLIHSASLSLSPSDISELEMA